MLLFSCFCFSQEFDWASGNAQIQWGIGVTGNFTDFKSGQLSDELIRVDQVEFTHDLVSFAYYFKNNWGPVMRLRRSFHSGGEEYSIGFITDLETEYEDNYFIEYRSKYPHKKMSFSKRVLQYYGGIGRKIEMGNFSLYPSFLIGSRVIELSYYTNRFKEVNSNTYVNYTILSNHYEEGEPNFIRTFELAPELKADFQITDNLELYASFQYAYFQTDLFFTENITNLYTGEVEIRRFDYDKYNHFFHVGFGIIFEPY